MPSVFDDDPRVRNLISHLSKKYNISYHKARKIITQQQRYTRKVMGNNSLDAIMWPFIGTFSVKAHKVRDVIRYIKEIGGDLSKGITKSDQTNK